MFPSFCYHAKEVFFMLFDVVTNEWDEVTYVPTALGNALLAVIVIVLLLGAMFFAKRSSKKMSPKQLAFCAASIALGTVLSNIKLFHFPTGGSITLLSMLVVCLPGYWFGLGAGLMTGIAYGVLQLLVDPYILFPAQLVLDYLLAFGALGLSGLFANAKQGLIKGYITGILGRYIFVVLSGWLFFATYAWEGWNPLLYSCIYNGIYIFAEGIVTIILLLLPPVKNTMNRIKGLTV